ncbi:MAG: proteasome beta subunit [archaeon GW2011_AR9]|nr:MAG: proteasome beta subunit [archaeon GW2011_AR9]MBS3120932.1 proteasome subunit beta [Candidatus Woesearchaeota archaeon]HIH12446.1 proteasome subunit beta [Candidatus Woesearchaeota archaeon]
MDEKSFSEFIMEEQLKTGTTTVGIACKDGIVLAADKRATAGNLVVDKRAEKVHILNDDFAVTIAGNVSDAQYLIKLIRAELKLKEVRTHKRTSAKEAANLLGGLLFTNIRRMSMLPGICHFLLGAKDDSGAYLYDLFPDGSVTKIRDYVSSGSGSVFAYGVLETQYRADMTTTEGVKVAIKAINTALQRDTYTGNGIDVIVVTDKEIKRVLQKELEISL